MNYQNTAMHPKKKRNQEKKLNSACKSGLTHLLSCSVHVKTSLCASFASCTRALWCVCVTRLIHTCDITHLYKLIGVRATCVLVWHESLICVTWLNYMRDRNHAWCVTWCIHTCDLTHLHVWRGAFIRVTWLIYMCGSCTCVTWLIHVCDLDP